MSLSLLSPASIRRKSLVFEHHRRATVIIQCNYGVREADLESIRRNSATHAEKLRRGRAALVINFYRGNSPANLPLDLFDFIANWGFYYFRGVYVIRAVNRRRNDDSHS